MIPVSIGVGIFIWGTSIIASEDSKGLGFLLGIIGLVILIYGLWEFSKASQLFYYGDKKSYKLIKDAFKKLDAKEQASKKAQEKKSEVRNKEKPVPGSSRFFVKPFTINNHQDISQSSNTNQDNLVKGITPNIKSPSFLSTDDIGNKTDNSNLNDTTVLEEQYNTNSLANGFQILVFHQAASAAQLNLGVDGSELLASNTPTQVARNWPPFYEKALAAGRSNPEGARVCAVSMNKARNAFNALPKDPVFNP